MAILKKDEAKTLLSKVISFSKADDCEVSLDGTEGGNIRYARNSVSTSGEVSTLTLAVTSSFGKKSGSATINEFDDTSLEKVVRRSEELAKLAPENPEYMPPNEPREFKEAKTFLSSTAAMTADDRADAVLKSIRVAKEAKLATGTLYIYFENKEALIVSLFQECIKNSQGYFFSNYNPVAPFKVGFHTIWLNIMQHRLSRFDESLFMEQCFHSPYIDEKIKTEAKKLFEPLKDLLVRGKKEHLIKNIDNFCQRLF